MSNPPRDPVLVLLLVIQLLILVWIGALLSGLETGAPMVAATPDPASARLARAVESLERALRAGPLTAGPLAAATPGDSPERAAIRDQDAPENSMASQLLELREMIARIPSVQHSRFQLVPSEPQSRSSQQDARRRLLEAEQLAEKMDDSRIVTRLQKEFMFLDRAAAVAKFGKPDEFYASKGVERWIYRISEDEGLTLRFLDGLVAEIYH